MASAARPWFVGASLLAHALPLLLLLRAAPPEPAPGAADAGTGGVEVALGPAGGAVGASAPERPFAEVAPVAPPPAASPPAPEPGQVAAGGPPPASEARPPEPVAEPPPPPDPAAALPEPVPAAPPPVTVAAAEEPPEVAAAAEPAPEAAPARAPAPRPLRRPPRRVAAAERAREPPRAAPAALAPPPPGEQGRGGAGTPAAAGAADARSGGGTPGAPAGYFTALQAWLERHKEYPRQARLRRQEGTVLLSFTFDRAGRVLGHRIARSSGHPALDREVAAMLDRAQPLPPIPEGVAPARLAVTVPVRFALR